MMSDLPQPSIDATPAHTSTADSKIPGFWQAVLLILMLLVSTGILSIIATIVYMIITVENLADISSAELSPVFSIWLTVVVNILVFGGVLWIGKAWSKRPWVELLPLSHFPARLPLWFAALLLLVLGDLIVLSEVDNISRYFFPTPDWLMELMKGLVTTGFGSFLVLAVVAPLTEEALFRGLMLNGFMKRYSPRKAVVLSAVLFAVVHLNPYQMLSAFFLGLLLAWLRIRSQSLWPCIFLHAFHNAMVYSISFLSLVVSGFSTDISGGHHFQPWWFNSIGIVLVFSGLWLTVKTFPGRVRQSSTDVII